ncbi:hypothetical protein EDB85DRAFT_2280303 [Lactarius pseudohatsudake]|nr:hypothetical protein EDB85DRAFT_2280303 [Lactarius pseudohatsudake]
MITRRTGGNSGNWVPSIRVQEGVLTKGFRPINMRSELVRLHEVVILVVGMEMDQEHDEGNICSEFLETTPEFHRRELLGGIPSPGSGGIPVEEKQPMRRSSHEAEQGTINPSFLELSRSSLYETFPLQNLCADVETVEWGSSRVRVARAGARKKTSAAIRTAPPRHPSHATPRRNDFGSNTLSIRVCVGSLLRKIDSDALAIDDEANCPRAPMYIIGTCQKPFGTWRESTEGSLSSSGYEPDDEASEGGSIEESTEGEDQKKSPAGEQQQRETSILGDDGLYLNYEPCTSNLEVSSSIFAQGGSLFWILL